ncbi:Protein kinase A anchor protein, nuclear localization signal domain protein [Cordyceps fumosorosea ARSEF 2679]|uniref:Protein kinase A anchor protein, nuclear localization signal domain protein n=1 Tax=Cordyceps fumosorosea (strain ARSEF 2679) TaxID=1081104 RepID=A0A167YGJ1_CORFA|nr:Protein kinase A anchor protein, nuclear localization signal domain protein [Cordyceps fumosorosea ARSEF 2679]OAA66297.1 Protein kinase A anchor protein, nuclear localization signal domain protein [Cordyceps fumosorosea ARSEF 2679]
MAARRAARARARAPARPTHFLCIPLLRRQLAHNVAAFRADVTNINSAAPLPPSAVRPPGTMHITLGVMNLAEPARLERALELLRQQQRQRQRQSRLCLTLKGLRAMQDPAATGVLYAPPADVEGQAAGGLRAYCEAVRRAFIEEGLMEPDGRPFVLHATVVNTAHVKRGRGERLMLDARGLLEEYAEHVWLDRHEVRSLAICRMGAQPKGTEGDEAYEVVEEVRV